MTESLIDIGVNLSNNRFKDDMTDTLQRAIDGNVSHIVLTGTSVAESEKVINFSHKLMTLLQKAKKSSIYAKNSNSIFLVCFMPP